MVVDALAVGDDEVAVGVRFDGRPGTVPRRIAARVRNTAGDYDFLQLSQVSVRFQLIPQGLVCRNRACPPERG